MAITNSDGSIVLSTKVDTSGIKKGMSSVKNNADSLTKTFSKLAKTIALAFSISKFVSFSMDAAKYATQTEASVQRLIDIYGSASDSVGDFIDENARALGMSKAAAASFSSVYGNLFSVWADQSTNANLTNKYLKMTAVVASKTGRTVEDVQERVRSGLLGNTEAIEDLGIFVNVKTIEMTDAFKRMANGKSWEQLDAYTQQQIRSMAILEQATAKYGNEVANTSATARSRLSAAYQDFKETWGRVINVILIPVIEKLTEIINYAIVAINLFSGRTGGILDGTKDTADNIGNAAENQEDLNEEIKETNKELKKALAGFDEIQILTSGISENEIDNSVPDIQNNVDNIESIGGSQDFEAKFNPMKIMQELKDALDYILPFIETALVVIGLILLSAGNIPLGIGFIAAGAYLYSVEERSGDKVFDFNVIKEDLAVLDDYLEEVLAVIGVILLFLGQIPFGIGFILAGATVYGVKEIKSSEYDEASLKEKLAVIGETVAVYLAVIGVILIMTGHIPLGLGFLFVGYELYDVSEQVLDEGAINTKINRFFEENKEAIVGVAVALLVIGVIMMMFGVFTPRSLGILVAGAAILATEEKMNKGAVGETIKSFFEENKELIVGVGAALLVIGVIMMMLGFITPLSLGILVAGGAILAAEEKINKGAVGETIENFFEENAKEIALLSAALLIIGILLLLVPPMLPTAIGLIAAGAVGLAKEAALNWNAIVDICKDFIFENPELMRLINGGLLIIGILTCLVNAPLGIALIAAGAVGLITTEAVLNPDAVVEWVDEAWSKVENYYNEHIAPVFTSNFWSTLGGEAFGGLVRAAGTAIKVIAAGLEAIGALKDKKAKEFAQHMEEWEANGGEVVYPPGVNGTLLPHSSLFGGANSGMMWGTGTNSENFNSNFGNEQSANNGVVKEEHYYLGETELMRVLYRLAKGGERLSGMDLIK